MKRLCEGSKAVRDQGRPLTQLNRGNLPGKDSTNVNAWEYNSWKKCRPHEH